jgi:hypothetical protein
MPRLSLYRPQKSSDYRFIDRTIKEMFTVGATDLLVHKYLGPANTGPSNDFTQPEIVAPNPLAIQDLLFLENRDRVYDPNIYRVRGHYSVANLDFDLSQFGLFLTNDIIFITVHYNNMIDLIGRKLMVGDVFELPHLTDYHPLNESIPIGLRRYYQITDTNFASEGFSQTWYPHLWRLKCEPLVDSQQFANILDEPTNADTYMGNWDPATEYQMGYTVTYGGKNYTPVKGPVPPGTLPTDPVWWKVDTNSTLRDLISGYNENIKINDAQLAEAARLVPETGYDRSQLYIVPTTLNNVPAPPVNVIRDDIGGPSLGRGTLTMVSSPNFKNSSYTIRVNADAAKNMIAGQRVTLSTGVTKVMSTDTGSGRKYGDFVLTATVNTGPIKTGPYGTADNTYATADQYPSFSVTTVNAEAQQTVIPLVEWSNDLAIGLVIRGTVVSINGTPAPVFADNTVITKLNKAKKTITVSNSLLASVSGTELEISYNFSGIYKSVTSEATAIGQNKIRLLTFNDDLVIGSVIRCVEETTTGAKISAFKPGTTVTGITTDSTGTVTISVSSATQAGLLNGARIEFAFSDGKLVNETMDFRADCDPRFQYIKRASPRSFGYVAGYMMGNAQAPNGEPTGNGIVFPEAPSIGDYFLRTDYLPQQLFRWDGFLWIKISSSVRTAFGTDVNSQTQLATIINNTGTVTLTDGQTIPSRQSLSDALRIQPD